MGFLAPFQPQIYAAFRIMTALMFVQHGCQKLLGWFDGPPELPPLLYVAGTIELVGGLMIALGLFAAIAAFLASGMMAVAYFMQHQPQGLVPIDNGGELAVLYCFAFLYIAAKGSGIWSVDQARGAGGGA